MKRKKSQVTIFQLPESLAIILIQALITLAVLLLGSPIKSFLPKCYGYKSNN